MKPNGNKGNLLVTNKKSVNIITNGSNVTHKKGQKLVCRKFDSSLSCKGQIKSSVKRLVKNYMH